MPDLEKIKRAWDGFCYQEPAVQMTTIAGVLVILLVLSVTILRLSLWLMPPKKYDPNFTSRSLTGWTNTPKKLAWARTVEKVSG